MPLPHLLPLYFALLVCLPLAVIFTVTSPRTAVTVAVTQPAFLVVRKPHNAPETLPIITIQPPASRDDESLLRLASQVGPNPRPESPKKLAFLFLTTDSLPLAPLWEIFFNQSPKNRNLYNIYINAGDSGRKPDPRFSGVFENRVIPSSKPAFRHTPTLISAARRLLAHALLDDPSNYVFILLSPSCVPLHSFNFTYTFLVSSAKSYIEILEDEPGWYDRWAARGQYAMLPEVRPEDFRIGSQFWALTRSHALMVARDVELWTKFNKPCVRRNVCYPEEHYFPTLVNMRDPHGQGRVPATLTHVDWSVAAGGHPRTYRPSEVGSGLIRRLRRARPRYGESPAEARNDPFLFARKFPPAAIGPLVDMAYKVIFNDSAVL
ncbi:PREDICTED: uncharacterized protein LOC104799235 [Tarenaya hassleriana]|uniref:uncharacterized protein LOC104799235 n=1 Tax=Tarenaya hassleriana TaxID=28532 RepID=UPI00053C0AC5|nr:PREDICTED: uncharacterized protein LOC104799235 [Tarenaya hassleriana]